MQFPVLLMMLDSRAPRARRGRAGDDGVRQATQADIKAFFG
jgi:hypothetical protein|nr:MAG TPA: hypothetical protein [Caudoviricetes sp.]